MELLRKSTYSVSQVTVDTTLYDMAVAVLTDAGLEASEYWVDIELQTYPVPYAWFEPQSHREALRKIAEACAGQVYCDRDGVVRVEGPSFLSSAPVPTTVSVFVQGAAFPSEQVIIEAYGISAEEYFRKDNPVKWSEIANYIQVDTQPLRPSAVAEEVYRSNDLVSINAGEIKYLTVYYNITPVIEGTASLEGEGANTSITGATYYAWGATIRVINVGVTADTFTLVINGKPLLVLNRERAIAQDDASITDNGRLKYTMPDNPFIQTLAVAQTIADTLLTTFKNPRRDVELTWRGDPALQLADRITVPDYKDLSTADYFVTRQTLEWDGGLTSTIQGRRAG
jgi:hypothetical protein